MLYTRKGDKGTTKTYGCDQRISKSSAVAEALGSLDEVNSFLGLVKVRAFAAKASGMAADVKFEVLGRSFGDIVHGVQQTLFMVQAEVAGFPMQMTEAKVTEAEGYTDAAEKILPPIKTFFISGGTELAASFDVARTLARRAERRVVAVTEAVAEGEVVKVSPATLAYLNRLSSLLYALARLSNHLSGIKEEPPAYK